MAETNEMWFRTRDQLWRALVRWWPKKKLDPDFPKMPLAGELAEDLMDLAWTWLPDEQLLVDVRRKLLDHDEHHLAERVTVALIHTQLIRGGTPSVERSATPEWYLWLTERVWTTRPEHNPKRMAIRLRFLADQVEQRSTREGYLFDPQMTLEVENPARPF